MALVKIDARIRTLIENCVETRQRSLFVIVGEKARDQAQLKAKPSVLWCYKNELGFGRNKKNRLEKVKKRMNQGLSDDSENLFDIFIESSKIRFCFYKQTKNVLGNTFGMLVLQDFEALTPNVLAQTIETVEGGGVICLLLGSITCLRQLYTLSMDVHARYRTEGFDFACHRFNERFILSLNDCATALVTDDSLTILPIFSINLRIEKVPRRSQEFLDSNQEQLVNLRESLADTHPIGTLLSFCRTKDQAFALTKAFEIVSTPAASSVIALTAPRGRGKSACLGLLVAGVISLGISNVYVTAPSPENLITLFEFVKKGLIGLGYDEKNDFEIILSQIDERKLVTSVKITKSHRQNVQYIFPNEPETARNAELFICDEAAAVPLPKVKRMLGNHHFILSSTVNGYEGTGRALSLKLIKELKESKRDPSAPSLTEVTLNESIRYADKDPVESWLNKLLCLDDSEAPRLEQTLLCAAKDCELYCVSRDTLFSYHKIAELFLQSLCSLFSASHYKNSPNDLQLLADAPAHNLFVLLPANQPQNAFPQVLCAIQTCFEGNICSKSVSQNLGRGYRPSGDLIPWTISQQFCEPDFASLSGCRIVRIATHPDFNQMGYGTRAIELLVQYFSSNTNSTNTISPSTLSTELTPHEEKLNPEVSLPPLLQKITDRPVEKIDYLGVSYGLTQRLLKFWKRQHFIPVYLRQSPNDLTGEYTCIMLRPLSLAQIPSWLYSYYLDFRNRFSYLLSYSFRELFPSLALSLMYNNDIALPEKIPSLSEVESIFDIHDLKRLENYANNMVDFHFIMDLFPKVARIHLSNKLDDRPNWVQLSIVLAIGLQYKSIETVEVATFNNLRKN